MDILKLEQPTRSSPFTPACSLSPYHSKTRLPGPKPSVSHKALLFALSMKWSNRLSVFSFAPFRSSTPPLDSAAFVSVPPSSKRISCNIPPAFPEETHVLRVLWHLSSNFSISITLDISYERLLIIYMFKE